MKENLRLKDILGLPFVPPPRLTRGAIRMRGRLLKTHRGMAPPPVRVLEGLFGLFDNRVLGLLVELDIPDLLSAPRTVQELAADTSADSDSLLRLLRYAAGRGFVNQERDGRFGANEVTDVLRRHHPNSWRGWVEFASSDWFWNAWSASSAAFKPNGMSAMHAATGSSFFDFVTNERPEAGDVFDRAMEAGATMQALALSATLKWDHIESVCDVGGGTGAALRVLLREHPHLQAVLFDLPHVVAKAGQSSDRLHIEGGDFFNRVPAQCDRYLMLAVIHDWNDDEAVQILRNVAAAMGNEDRAFVVENELSQRARGEFVEASDLLMLVLGSGRERTRSQFKSLFRTAGLSLEKAHPLPTGFTAFELRTNHAT
jgi:C-methyltransferase